MNFGILQLLLRWMNVLSTVSITEEVRAAAGCLRFESERFDIGLDRCGRTATQPATAAASDAFGESEI
ncbi:MAG TPA: hypothetical protein PJ986_02600 [Gammaproteobacteria bacterium]|nr:hypothetical protein [Gammaproteobacteria bacterium]